MLYGVVIQTIYTTISLNFKNENQSKNLLFSFLWGIINVLFTVLKKSNFYFQIVIISYKLIKYTVLNTVINIIINLLDYVFG